MTRASDLLINGGEFSRKMPSYEYRESQIDMVECIEELLENRQLAEDGEGNPVIGLIEGPTGTGKGSGYLIPSIHAIQERKARRVVVATANIALQEQLVNVDLPFLAGVMPKPFTYALMKGHNNYVCLKRWQEEYGRSRSAPRKTRIFDDLNAWLARTETADKAELEFDASWVWRDISCPASECTKKACKLYRDCYVFKARRGFQAAQVLVLNYHMLMASCRYMDFLPEHEILVCDEAHAIADVARSFWGDEVTEGSARWLSRRLQRKNYIKQHTGEQFEEAVAVMLEDAAKVLDRKKVRPQRILHEGGLDVTRPDDLLELMQKEITGSEPSMTDEEEHATWEILADKVREWRIMLRKLEKGTSGAYVVWIETYKDKVYLNRAPVDVSGILPSCLFDREKATILTSATMTSNGRFDFLKREIGVPEANVVVEERLESPYDYRNQAVLYLPRNLPEPNRNEYMDAAIEEATRVVELIDGGVLMLCTSNYAMNKFHDHFQRTLRRPVLCQGQMGKQILLRKMREQEGLVLVATRSFFEGVDIPGRNLECVIIDKLPFPVPSDPIVSSLQNYLEEITEQSGWYMYSLPRAVIDICQAVGRLIRRRSDRGVVCILDARLQSKQYRWNFFESMPAFKRTKYFSNVEEFYRG